MDWINLAVQFGIPLLILAAVAVFFAKQVWPFIKEAWTEQQAERIKEREKFLAALERHDAVQEETVGILKGLVSAVNTLNTRQERNEQAQQLARQETVKALETLVVAVDKLKRPARKPAAKRGT